MRTPLLFIAVAACSGGGSASPPPQLRWAPRPPIDAAPDAALPAPIARGGACGPREGAPRREDPPVLRTRTGGDRFDSGPTNVCAAGLTCQLETPGGSCTSRCGVLGGACDDGACATTVRDGDVCLAKCERDGDCRTAEGYFCDPHWKACAIPNTLAMVPRTCPGPTTRDPAFGPTTPLTSPSSLGVFQQEPAAVLTSDGSLFVIAAAPGNEVTQLVDTTTRARAAKLFVETAPALPPSASLARDRKGVLYATWLDTRRGPQVLFVRSRDDGRTWSVPAPVNDVADCSGLERCLAQTFVIAGPDPANKQRDLVHVAYVAGGALRVRASYDEGASFRAPVTALSAIRASATVDATGRLHVIGVQGGPLGAYGSASHAITYATSSDAGRTFTRPAQLHKRDERLPFYAAVPRLVVDTKRKWIYAVYVRGGRDAVWDLAVLASKDSGATWKRTRIGDDCAIHMTPQAALDPTTGKLHLAWYDTQGAAGRFAHATCAPGLATCSAPLAINDRAFGALSTARLASGSVGDSAAVIVDDKRRTLHAVWTQPLDEAGAIKARIFHATAKVPNR